MTLDQITQRLFNEVDALTEPNAIFEEVRPRIDPASEALRAQYTRGTVQGPEVIDRFEDAAKIYLEAAGVTIENGDKRQYASIMRNYLGDNLNAVLEAIKIDDLDELAKLFKDGLVSGTSSANLQSTVSRITSLASDKLVAFGRAAAEKIGGTDYVSVIRDIPGYIMTLTQVKAVQRPYSTNTA